MTSARRPEALGLAERAYGLVQTNPFAAHRLAEEALAFARSHRDSEAHAAALHALGWAQADLGDPRALQTMRAAVRTAERHNTTTARQGCAAMSPGTWPIGEIPPRPLGDRESTGKPAWNRPRAE